jgi:methionyl-tRNA formyltransferase
LSKVRNQNIRSIYIEVITNASIWGRMKINVAIVTIDEPFYLPSTLKSLIDMSPKYIKYVSIILVPMIPKKMSQWQFTFNQIQVFGISQFIKIAALYTKKKLMNAISYREYSVAKVAKNNGIPVRKTNSLRCESLIEYISSLSLDIILSIASSRIFGKPILSVPKLGCINVHAGMLPKYRGINPSFWALLNQEKKSAVTVHFINDRIDDGDIIQQDIFDIEGITRLHDLYMKIVEIAPNTIVKSLVSIEENNLEKTKNERSKSSYYSFPKKEDGRKFRNLGLTYI